MLTLFPLVTLSIKDKTDSHCCILLFSCYCPQIRRRRLLLLFFSWANLAESKVAVEREREGVAQQQEGEETAAHVTVVGVSTFFFLFLLQTARYSTAVVPLSATLVDGLSPT